MDQTINPFWNERLKTVEQYGLDADASTDQEVQDLMAVMARYGLADEVTDELRSIDAPMTISTIQNFYYAQLVLQFMDRVGISRPADFLEIGGGGGLLALFLYRTGAVSSYTLVDFTEMLSVARRTMERFSIKGPVRYLITGEIRNVPDDSVDVALNFNSFMEMDRDVRDNYFEEIYRTTRPRGLFMNCNRMQRHMTMRDDRKYENNPLT